MRRLLWEIVKQVCSITQNVKHTTITMTSCTAGVSEGLGANPDLLCFFTFGFQNDKPLLGRRRKKKKKTFAHSREQSHPFFSIRDNCQ